MLYVATIFDKNYLVRALAFYRSTEKYLPDAKHIFIYPDIESEEVLLKLNLKNVELRRIEDIPDPEFLSTKNNRSPVEFMITAKSCWMKYLLETLPLTENDILSFIDPDILFYSSITDVVQRILKGNYSIAITPHKFQPKKEFLNNKVGKYNAGVIFFKKDATALACLSEWRKQCIDWCYLRYEAGKIGDQMYLNDWTQKYSGVYELPDKGVNLGTWNTERFKIIKNKNTGFSVDGEPLICYHFHGLKIYLDKQKKIRPYPVSVSHSGIYSHYVKTLIEAESLILGVDPKWNFGFALPLSFLRKNKQRFVRIWKKIVHQA